MKKYRIFALAFLGLVVACNDSASDRIKDKTLDVSYQKKDFYPGDKLSIKISDETIHPDSVKLSGVELVSYKQAEKTIVVKFNSVGAKNIGIQAYENGKALRKTINVSVYSNVTPKKLKYEIVEVINHDPEVYTQGLEMHEGILYESRGQYEQSDIRSYDKPGGKLLKAVSMPPQYFGEGLTILNDTVFQLTWRARKCYRYYPDLSLMDVQDLPTVEGWGLCNDGKDLFVSDGTHILYKLDKKLTILGSQQIYDGKIPLTRLNELEFANGKIYANVYTTDDIYVIDPKTGSALAYVDLSALKSQVKSQKAEVLNGIAYMEDKDQFIVTGKYWDKAFIIKLI